MVSSAPPCCSYSESAIALARGNAGASKDRRLEHKCIHAMGLYPESFAFHPTQLSAAFGRRSRTDRYGTCAPIFNHSCESLNRSHHQYCNSACHERTEELRLEGCKTGLAESEDRVLRGLSSFEQNCGCQNCSYSFVESLIRTELSFGSSESVTKTWIHRIYGDLQISSGDLDKQGRLNPGATRRQMVVGGKGC